MFNFNRTLDRSWVSEIWADDSCSFEEDHDNSRTTQLSIERLHRKFFITSNKCAREEIFVNSFAKLWRKWMLCSLYKMSKSKSIFGINLIFCLLVFIFLFIIWAIFTIFFILLLSYVFNQGRQSLFDEIRSFSTCWAMAISHSKEMTVWWLILVWL